MEVVRKLATGCSSLDTLLNGGVESGVITNVYGEPGAGKSNFCMQLVANVVRAEKTVVFVDSEGSFSVERLQQMVPNANLDTITLVEPKTFEEQRYAFTKIEQVVREVKPALVVVDSLVALYRLELQEGIVTETNRELSIELALLSKIARELQIPVVVTNQVYTDFETKDVQVVGKDVPLYWAKALIKLERLGKGKRKAVVKKHRSIPEGKDAIFTITDSGLAAEERKIRIF